MPSLTISTFYEFVEPLWSQDEVTAIESAIKARCVTLGLVGNVLLAAEGINGTLCGNAEAVRGVVAWLHTLDRRLASLISQESVHAVASDEELRALGTPFDAVAPFRKLCVRSRKELVDMNVDGLHIPSRSSADGTGSVATHLRPHEWNDMLRSNPDVVVLDVRNEYETAVGTFENALPPDTKAFSEWPAYAEKVETPAPSTIGARTPSQRVGPLLVATFLRRSCNS
jgi:UPF0176 protein